MWGTLGTLNHQITPIKIISYIHEEKNLLALNVIKLLTVPTITLILFFKQLLPRLFATMDIELQKKRKTFYVFNIRLLSFTHEETSVP